MAAYKIDIDFAPNWIASGRSFLLDAANRWMSIVTSSPPAVDIGGGKIVPGLLVRAAIIPGAAGGSFARSGPDFCRPASASYLPATAVLELEQGDFDALRAAGRLGDVLFHELGHAMGFGFLWSWKGFIQGRGSADPRYVGLQGQAAYGALLGTGPTPVPVEAGGGDGVAGMHWREIAFGNELMSPYLPGLPNPLSRVTLASMADLGYAIDPSKAEQYMLPPSGHFFNKELRPSGPTYRVVPTTPVILPDTSLARKVARKRATRPAKDAELAAAAPRPAKRGKKPKPRIQST